MTPFTITLTDHTSITIKATGFNVNAKNQLILEQWDRDSHSSIPVALFDAGQWADVVRDDTIVDEKE